MKFKEIRWKNLLSYGNKIQSYTLGDSPKLVHIQGENGAGKSSIKEALTISTYGKSAIRKMKDIPNWINRNAYTYNEFETTGGDNIIIERGIDPNFHRIKINGVSHNLPDKKKIDEYIEKELLDLNFSIFCNTVSLSFDDFKSFVTLSAADKRKIIDPMFGIDVLNQVKDTIKTDKPIKIIRDLRPKFELESFTNKLNIRIINDKERLLEFYVSIYPDEYDRKTRLFLSEVKKAIKNPRASNMLDIIGVGFTSYKDIGVKDFHQFHYEVKEFDKIVQFDGYYVIKFKSEVILNGEYLLEKYRLEELDQKYKNKESKR